MRIKGIYKKNLFFNPETGLAAFLLKPDIDCSGYTENHGWIKVVGKFCLQQKGLPLEMEGEWHTSDYGPEFHIMNVKETCGTICEMEDFIKDLGFPISPRNIRKILGFANGDLFQLAMASGSDKQLISATGAEVVTAAGVLTKIRALKIELDLFKFLIQYNGTYEHVVKALKKYPDDALEILKTNPYEMIQNAGLPFKLIDQIALKNGVEPLSEERVKAIISWCVHRDSNSGNVYMNFDQLCRLVGRMFQDIPKPAIISALKDHPFIKKDPDYPDDFYESYLLRDEVKAAKEFVRLMRSRIALPYHPEYIDRIEQERGFAFGNQQRQAFQLLTSTGFKMLTGDPGTGKTTTVNGLLKYLEMLWVDLYGHKPVFALCAPSGRAAQRMKETTGRNALTIHKLIEYQPFGENEYYKDENDPIEADVIVIDETSMLGLSTFTKLIAAIKSGSLVFMVGDTNQLPSVEPGSVLQDIINTCCVDRCHLSEVFRQAEESLINRNAKKVIHGDPELLQGPDFKITKCNREETPAVLRQCVMEMMAKYDKNSIQVLSPVKKGTCGVKEGNNIIQNIFNPGKGGVWYGFRNYKPGDRVIMMSNNYATGYYNGDINYIDKIGDSCMEIRTADEILSLTREQWGDMDLAYSITVHKSQGSEYDHLIIVLQEDAAGMLDRNLLYTAITRGKKEVRIIYEGDALERSIRTASKTSRNSHLVQRIQGEIIKTIN